MRATLIGPSGSGKTHYLLSLAQVQKRNDNRRIHVAPHNQAAEVLWERVEQFIQGSTLDGTSEVRHYAFQIDLPGSIFNLGKKTFHLHMVDTQGGGSFTTDDQSLHPEVVKQICKAEAVFLLIPAKHKVTNYLPQIEKLLAEIKLHKAGKGPMFKRFVIGVSQAERLVMHQSIMAHQDLEKKNAEKAVINLIGESALARIKSETATGGMWYSLISAYGFADDGSPNSQLFPGGGMSLKHISNRQESREFVKAMNQWQPYNIWEPLEFLGRGYCDPGRKK